MSAQVIEVLVRVGGAEQPQRFHGRLAWALHALADAGEAGCTPMTHPGPRWSGYVHRLKKQHGLRIESVPERHGGAYAGGHVRYRLRTPVTVLEAVRHGQ